DRLVFKLNDKTYSWELDAGKTEHTSSENDTHWNVTMRSYRTPRHKVYQELAPMLKGVEESVRESVFQDLSQVAGVPRHVRHSHRTLGREELIRLEDGGLVEVG